MKVTNNERGDEYLKCHIQEVMNDDTFLVFIEKLAEKRLMPLSSLRPIYVASSSMDRYSGDLNGNAKARNKRQRIENFTTAYNSDAICNSAFDFEPYINLANFTLSPTSAHRELIAYPMHIYTQAGTMNANKGNNSSNGGNSTGNSKSIKNRQSNGAQNQTNDGGDGKLVHHNDTDNVGAGANGGVQQYGKKGHELKSDSQPTIAPSSSSLTTGHQQLYHPQQHQMPEPNDGAAAGNTQSAQSGYYHQQSTVPASTAPAVYYYPADEQMYPPSDMVLPHGIYAIPAATGPHSMQPNMYAPAISPMPGHYPAVQVGNWPPYAQTVNPQGKLFNAIAFDQCQFGQFLHNLLFSHLNISGYVLSAPPPYALSAIQPPQQITLPFLSRELCRSDGRPNYNQSYSVNASGEDLPCNLNEIYSSKIFSSSDVFCFILILQ